MSSEAPPQCCSLRQQTHATSFLLKIFYDCWRPPVSSHMEEQAATVDTPASPPCKCTNRIIWCIVFIFFVVQFAVTFIFLVDSPVIETPSFTRTKLDEDLVLYRAADHPVPIEDLNGTQKQHL